MTDYDTSSTVRVLTLNNNLVIDRCRCISRYREESKPVSNPHMRYLNRFLAVVPIQTDSDSSYERSEPVSVPQGGVLIGSRNRFRFLMIPTPHATPGGWAASVIVGLIGNY